MHKHQLHNYFKTKRTKPMTKVYLCYITKSLQCLALIPNRQSKINSLYKQPKPQTNKSTN